VERWAGNGEQMAKSKQNKLEPVVKTGKKTTGKRAAPSGMRTLRKAAGKTVGENSEKITASLLKGMLAGKAGSGKLLLDLAEQEPENEDEGKNRRGRSAASDLAAEPEWQEPLSEADAETDPGSREPEG
jgi:hypothetical protein